MRFERKTLLRTLLRSESGQVIPITALWMVVILAMIGLVVDVGHVYLCHRELQASCDAAALAGAEVIPTSTTAGAVQATAINYSSASGGKNIYNNMTNVSMVSGYPVLKCLSSMQTQGISCVGNLPYNAIQVMQQATVPMYFAVVIGKSSMTITAASTAAKGGASSRPYNVALVLDTTLSETYYDADCGNTQMLCTLNGVQILLQHLDPCGTSQTTCSITAGNSLNSVVRTAIFTFPQVNTSTAHLDTDCSNSYPTANAYTFPLIGAGSYVPGSTTYRILDFQSDYRTSDFTSTLNPSSALTMAVGATSGCTGMGTPSNAYIYGTYYAATIYAAQSALVREQAIYPDSQNVMIIIGDGDSNAPHTNGSYTVMASPATALGLYPSYYGECGQAISAANFATGQNTRVYSVAYGSPPSGCTYDQSGQGHATGLYPDISPCNTMASMASRPYYFFSDFKQQSGVTSTCTAAQSMVSLNDIFLQIAGDLTVARLIPNATT
jgi:Flp pilus assembly protein TadG